MRNYIRLVDSVDRSKIIKKNIKKIGFDFYEFKSSGYTDPLEFCSHQISKIIAHSLKDYLKNSSLQMKGVIFKPTPINKLDKTLISICRVIKFEGELYLSYLSKDMVFNLYEFENHPSRLFRDVKKALDKPFVVSGVYVFMKLEDGFTWLGELPISFLEYHQISVHNKETIENIPIEAPDYPYMPVAFA